MLSSSPANLQPLRLGFRPVLTRPSAPRPGIPSAAFHPPFLLKPRGLGFSGRHCDGRRYFLPVAASEESATHGISDGEVENKAIELQASKDPLKTSEFLVEKHAPKFAAFQKWRKRRRTRPGIMINMALIAVLLSFLLFFDWCSWRIVRLPLGPFYFTRPFLISAALSACAGWLYVPMVDSMNIHQILREEGPTAHYIKKGTPTMGGIFFVPIGIAVAICIAGQRSIQIYGAAVGTLAYAAIGLLDDLLSCVKGHNYGLPGWIKLTLQVAVGILFALWLDSANITAPYKMKLFVPPLSGTFGLVHLGKGYLVLTAFCFAAMGNGVNLTDGLDGLAGGVAAWAFIAMSVAVLAICPDLAIFGASMAGACVGFLFHNRYKASVFMGDTGSLALGGALAAMASCTGMFIPLFITSGVFVMEALSVVVQVSYVKFTRWLYGEGRRFFRMAPVHHHFELCGFKEPIIVASAYFMSCIFALCAAYIGLISG